MNTKIRTIADVIEDIKNGTWGSDTEYQSECEKLHKLCDEILEIEKAKMEKIIAKLEEKAQDYHDRRVHHKTIGNLDNAVAFGHKEDAVRKSILIVRKGDVK